MSRLWLHLQQNLSEVHADLRSWFPTECAFRGKNDAIRLVPVNKANPTSFRTEDPNAPGSVTEAGKNKGRTRTGKNKDMQSKTKKRTTCSVTATTIEHA